MVVGGFVLVSLLLAIFLILYFKKRFEKISEVEKIANENQFKELEEK